MLSSHLSLAAPAPPVDSVVDDMRTAVDKAFDVLAAFPGGGATIGVSELARNLALSKSTVFRLLTIMERNGFVEHHGSRYRLGRRLYDLGAHVYEPQPGSLHELLSPCMAYLYEQSHETVHLGILLDAEVALLGRIHRQRATSRTARIGSRFPAHCTALGKAMLAHDPDTAEALIAHGLRPRTPHSIVDGDTLRAELQRTRGRGVAVSRDEARARLSCVAVPLLDETGRPVAALSIGGTTNAFDSHRHAALLRSVAAEAQRMARQASRLSRPAQHLAPSTSPQTPASGAPEASRNRRLAAAV
jgi:DNA-binding IclR family transcriptional regulator